MLKKADADRIGSQASHGYPRPMLRRTHWESLNGPWEFALDVEGKMVRPEEVAFDRKIVVPFAPESPASTVEHTGFIQACWYRREFTAPPLQPGEHLMLHFGAVDHRATVWVNGHRMGEHEGGYTPFRFDITPHLRPEGPQQIVVHAEDDPHDLAKPRGKQDWQATPHSIWYPRTTGIWQTVWLERLSSSWIGRIRWTPSIERWEIGFEASIEGDTTPDMKLRVLLRVADHVLADDTCLVLRHEVHRRIALSDPGIDDFRNELLWYPHTPTLIFAELQLLDGSGKVLDQVRSYTALRSIGVQGDRFVLNSRPYHLRLVLDQGYWPQTGISTPDDHALRRDIKLVKAMGFNGVRAHQKVFDPRYLYWADVLGLVVWEEMPSAYRFTRTSVQRVVRQWTEVIERDASHPCIIAWVPFNESWGVPDLPDSPAQRHCVQALYHLTRTLDPTRPVVGNDGWESVATDIIGIHDYDDDPSRLGERYRDHLPESLFETFRPGGRLLMVGSEHAGQPIVLSEFGGIALSPDTKATWGYSRVRTAQALARRYRELLEVVRNIPMFAGFCYTQFTDTYQETNGLLDAWRRPKFPLKAIAKATGGLQSMLDQRAESRWRQRMMHSQRDLYLVPAEDHALRAESRT